MDPSVKVATVLLVLCTACALTRALQLELASVVSVLFNMYTKRKGALIYMCKCDHTKVVDRWI